MEARNTQQVQRRNGGSWCSGAWSLLCQRPGTMAARYIYAGLFLAACVYAWLLRENPKSFFQRQHASGCNNSRICLASENVLVISLTFFLFHMFMFVTTVGTRSIHDRRNLWHASWWPSKVLLLVGCFWLSSVASSDVLQIYGKIAHFGAGIFLIIQMISVVRYITRLYLKWCAHGNYQIHSRKVIWASKLAYVCSVVGSILMVLFYVGCYVNAWIVFATVMLVYFMPIVSILNKDHKGFYLEPALMGVYIVFLCWSAIKSEPESSGCYNKGDTSSWITITSFVLGLISIAVSVFSTGTDYKCIQFWNVVESGDDVPYGYGFFHFVFAMASMHFAMLFLGWDAHHPSERWSIDVGWTSTLVHIVNEGLAVISLITIIIARRYGIDWLHNLLAQIFGIGGQQQQEEHAQEHAEQQQVHEELEGSEATSTATATAVTAGNNNDGAPREEEEEEEDQSREETTTVTGNGAPPPQAAADSMGATADQPVEEAVRDDIVQPPCSSSSSSTTPPPTTTGRAALGAGTTADDDDDDEAPQEAPAAPPVASSSRGKQYGDITEEW